MGEHLSASLSVVNTQELRHERGYELCNAQMRTIEEVRRVRLQELRDEFGSWAELNRLLGLSDRDSTLSQIMSPTVSKDMGSTLARRLESVCRKEPGWMDTDPGLWPFKAISLDRVRAIGPAGLAQLEAGIAGILAAIASASATAHTPAGEHDPSRKPHRRAA